MFLISPNVLYSAIFTFHFLKLKSIFLGLVNMSTVNTLQKEFTQIRNHIQQVKKYIPSVWLQRKYKIINFNSFETVRHADKAQWIMTCDNDFREPWIIRWSMVILLTLKKSTGLLFYVVLCSQNTLDNFWKI